MTTEEKKFQAKLKMIKYNVSYIQDDGKSFEANVKGKYMATKSKMSIEDLANIIIPRLDKIENTLEEHSEKFILIESRLNKIENRLEQHSIILQEHSDIFLRNNLK